jgi:anti-sigma regulatory factor (Ser/Thr protein kinase)
MDQPSTVWAHAIQLPPDARSASKARTFVGRHLLAHDLPYLTDDVQLVVSELATNALAHAETPFAVTLAASAQSVLLRVQDRSARPLVPGTGAPLDTHGRGLSIVDVLSLDWGVTVHTDGGKTVWAAFDNHRDRASALGCG